MALYNFQSNFVFRKEGNSALLLNINFPISFTLNISTRSDGFPEFSLIYEVEVFLYKEERRTRTHFIVLDDSGNDRVGKTINTFTMVLSSVPDLQSFRDIPSQRNGNLTLHVALVRGSKTPHECQQSFRFIDTYTAETNPSTVACVQPRPHPLKKSEKGPIWVERRGGGGCKQTTAQLTAPQK